ncbi:MAG: hypothetical protein HFI88_10110 [Lachnospiraceae bacterium]|nr:hypothetical protein [Lachnospiraceae bacterium]
MLDKEGILEKIQRKTTEFKACFRTGRYREAKNAYDELVMAANFVELDGKWRERIFGSRGQGPREGGLITEYEQQMAYYKCSVEKNISWGNVTFEEFRQGLPAGTLAGKRPQCLQEVKPCNYPDCKRGQGAACGSLF